MEAFNVMFLTFFVLLEEFSYYLKSDKIFDKLSQYTLVLFKTRYNRKCKHNKKNRKKRKLE